MALRHELPSGSVTLLLTDIEGSTRLLNELGAEAYEEALAEHRSLLREAFTRAVSRVSCLETGIASFAERGAARG